MRARSNGRGNKKRIYLLIHQWITNVSGGGDTHVVGEVFGVPFRVPRPPHNTAFLKLPPHTLTTKSPATANPLCCENRRRARALNPSCGSGSHAPFFAVAPKASSTKPEYRQ